MTRQSKRKRVVCVSQRRRARWRLWGNPTPTIPGLWPFEWRHEWRPGGGEFVMVFPWMAAAQTGGAA